MNSALKDHGVDVTHTPATITNNNVTGDREITDGTPTTIKIVFENPNLIFDLLNQGESENSDVKAFVKNDVVVNHNDKIEWNNIKFRVENVSPRYFGANHIFNTIKLFLIEN